MRLGSDSVLIRENGGGTRVRGVRVRRARVDGGDDGKVVLVFEEIGVGDGEGSVQGILQGGVEASE